MIWIFVFFKNYFLFIHGSRMIADVKCAISWTIGEGWVLSAERSVMKFDGLPIFPVCLTIWYCVIELTHCFELLSRYLWMVKIPEQFFYLYLHTYFTSLVRKKSTLRLHSLKLNVKRLKFFGLMCRRYFGRSEYLIDN